VKSSLLPYSLPILSIIIAFCTLSLGYIFPQYLIVFNNIQELNHNYHFYYEQVQYPKVDQLYKDDQRMVLFDMDIPNISINILQYQDDQMKVI